MRLKRLRYCRSLLAGNLLFGAALSINLRSSAAAITIPVTPNSGTRIQSEVPAASHRVPSSKKLRVAVLGDSIVADGLLVRYLRSELGDSWRIDNYGVNGESPGHMAQRVRRWDDGHTPKLLVPSRFDYVVVLAGVNGIYPDVDARNGARTQLARLFSRLKTLGNTSHHPKLVGLTMLPWGGWHKWSKRQEDNTQVVNRWLTSTRAVGDDDSTSAAVDVAVDAYTALLDPTTTAELYKGAIRPRMFTDYTIDGLHLSENGAEYLAELLGRALLTTPPPDEPGDATVPREPALESNHDSRVEWTASVVFRSAGTCCVADAAPTRWLFSDEALGAPEDDGRILGSASSGPPPPRCCDARQEPPRG